MKVNSVGVRSFVCVFISSLIHYYDYHLFGLLAAEISKTFMPSQDPTAQLINTYGLMFMSVLAKPFGALVIGRLGDIFGRHATLRITLFCSSVSALIISCTPSWDSIGICACIIIVGCRMIICSSTTSGTDSARLYIYELTNPGKKFFGVSTAMTFNIIGSFLASLSALFFTLDYFGLYGWRIAIGIGAACGMLMFYIVHKNAIQPCSYQDIEGFEHYKNMNLVNIVKEHSKTFVFGCILSGCIGSAYGFNVIFLGTYHFNILNDVDKLEMRYATSYAIGVCVFGALLAGYCYDRLNCRQLVRYAASAILTLTIIQIVFGFNKFAYIASNFCLPFLLVPSLVTLKKIMPVVVRHRLMSMCHAIGSVVISAPTPMIATQIYKATQISSMPYLYFVAAIIGMAAIVYTYAENNA